MEEYKKEQEIADDSKAPERKSLDIKKVGKEFVEKEVRGEFLKIFIEFARISLAMVVALSWNEAIPALVHQVLPGMGGATVGLFVYAITITIIAVLVISMLGKIKPKGVNDNKKSV